MASEQSISQDRLGPLILIGGADAGGVVEPSVASLFVAPCVYHEFKKVPDGNESVRNGPEIVKAFDFRAHAAGHKAEGPAATRPASGRTGFGGADRRRDRLRRGRLRGGGSGVEAAIAAAEEVRVQVPSAPRGGHFGAGRAGAGAGDL